jgi:hypothetical protein
MWQFSQWVVEHRPCSDSQLFWTCSHGTLRILNFWVLFPWLSLKGNRPLHLLLLPQFSFYLSREWKAATQSQNQCLFPFLHLTNVVTGGKGHAGPCWAGTAKKCLFPNSCSPSSWQTTPLGEFMGRPYFHEKKMGHVTWSDPLCVWQYMFACMCIWVHVCICVRVYIYVCACICVCICIYVCESILCVFVCVYMCMWVCVCIYMCMSEYMCTAWVQKSVDVRRVFDFPETRVIDSCELPFWVLGANPWSSARGKKNLLISHLFSLNHLIFPDRITLATKNNSCSFLQKC